MMVLLNPLSEILQNGERLIRLGYSPTRLIFDTTNQFTYIEKGGKLPRKGKSKQKRYDKNIVGLGLAVNDQNLPFLSSVYPGNKHDSDVFVEFFNAICSRLEDLKVDRKKITLIFDRGVNSEINVGNVVDKMHIVGALTRSQAKDFFTVPLDDFSFLYKNMKEHVIKGYRFENVAFFGREFTLVTSHNEATHKRQEKTYERRKKRILEVVKELKKKAVRKGRGRKLTMKGATNRLVDTIPKQLRGVFDYSVSKGENGLLDIKCDIITGAEKDLYRSFGKNAIFTDNTKWTSEEIVRAYNSKSEIEDDFKWLHDKVLIPLQPFWVWKDISLRAHVFLCVMGLLLYRYLLVELSYEQLSLPRLAKMLEDIRLAVVKEGEKKAHIVVEEMAAEQAHIFSTLQLDRFVPK
jgi:transposase